jgi:hypothetical protein
MVSFRLGALEKMRVYNYAIAVSKPQGLVISRSAAERIFRQTLLSFTTIPRAQLFGKCFTCQTYQRVDTRDTLKMR